MHRCQCFGVGLYDNGRAEVPCPVCTEDGQRQAAENEAKRQEQRRVG